MIGTQLRKPQRFIPPNDSNGNNLSCLTKHCNGTNCNNASRQTYTYSTEGYLLTFLTENLRGSQWEAYEKYTHIYDSSGKKHRSIKEFCSQGVWMTSGFTNYIYDTNGNLITELGIAVHNYVGNPIPDTSNSSRTSYTYDSSGNTLSNTHEYWSATYWRPDERKTYTYNLKNKKLSTLTEYGNNNAWIVRGRSTYTYNSVDSVTSALYEIWRNGAWVNGGITILTYDTNGNFLSNNYKYWAGNKWVDDYIHVYAYNENGNSISGKYEKYINNEWQPYKVDQLNIYAAKTKDDVFYNLYRYEVRGNAVINSTNEPLTVYPNPASEELYLMLYKNEETLVEIFDIHGRFCFSEKFDNTKSIDVSRLSNGIYLLKVKNSSLNYHGKFIKK